LGLLRNADKLTQSAKAPRKPYNVLPSSLDWHDGGWGDRPERSILQLMTGSCQYQSTFARSIPNNEFADIASQLEEILSEVNQVSDPTLRRRMLASMRLLIREADRLGGSERERFQIS
jgi:hypothetical protein